ncbi:MAG TPA: MltA domain-containing protein [Tepidisphaeraceae bacterium]|nr:MltA domain-containing protein [Tepidisphaeraceae bacterium]
MVRKIAVWGVTLLMLAGCHQNAALNYSAQLPPGELALRKIPESMYPTFSTDPQAVGSLHQAIQYSLEYMVHPSSQAFYPYGDISHDRAVATLKALDAIIEDPRLQSDPKWIDDQIRQNFEVYESVGAPASDGSGYSNEVLFTGYFTPIYQADLTRHGAYQWPLYKRPADLVSNDVTGVVQGRRTGDGSIVPYYTREQIESGALKGDELCWLTSRWEAYVVTVQGSGRLKLPDGSIYEVGYAGNNGYEYTSIGDQMVADGVITAEQRNFFGLRDYFSAHPEAMDKYIPINQRTVFFQPAPGGPYGKLNVPVTAFRTIATDKETHDIYPRAMPAFVMTVVPTPDGGKASLSEFMLDQDTGGAIRAAGRCDIYMGIGPQAEKMAGDEVNQGKLYYIAIKPELVQQYLGATQPSAMD